MTNQVHTQDPHGQSTAVSARWRIVGWIVLTTALALLATTVSMRTLLLHRVATDHNAAITQEIEEFRLFTQGPMQSAADTQRFPTLDELMQRYLSQQTPATGESMISSVEGHVLYTDNASDDAGERLAADPELLRQVLEAPDPSGIIPLDQGTARWGKVQVQGQDNVQSGTFIVVLFDAAEVREVNRQIIILAGVASGGLFLTAGIAWLAAGRILHPIRTMRDVADSVTAQDLSVRIPIQGRDDIAQLGLTLNSMLDRVEEAYASQRHFVTEARQRLHGPLERISRGLRDAADPAGIRRELRLMERLLDNLEILSAADLPGFVHGAEGSAEQLTQRLFATATRLAPERRWNLAGIAHGTVWVDAQRLEQAVAQLIRNAADHTQDGDTVELGTTLEQGLFTVWVANRGPALDEEAAQELFENYRSGSAVERETGEAGMGLGLAVTKAVADAHHGSAWVESEESLTRFGLDIPASPPDVATTLSQEEHADRMHRLMRTER